MPSRVSFLIGPLENGRTVTKKVRTVRQRKADVQEETGEEESPEELEKKQKKDADQLSQAERNFKQMKKIIDKQSNDVFHERVDKYNAINKNEPMKDKARRDLKERGNEVDAVRFLLNPNSFTQSVENVFNASHMVKKGDAKMKFRKPAPLGDSNANPLDLPESWTFASTDNGGATNEGEYDGQATQCVLSFTMADWRRLCESRGMKKGDRGDLPHRRTNITRDTQSQELSQDA